MTWSVANWGGARRGVRLAPCEKTQTSNSKRLQAGDVILEATRFSQEALANWRSDVEWPLVLNLGLQRNSDAGFASTYAGPIATERAANANPENVELYVAAILEYGSGGATNKRIFDWKGGTFQLPPVTFAEISLAWWSRSNTIANNGVAVLGNYEASFSMGHFPYHSQRMTVTDQFQALAVPEVFTFTTPPGARWLRVTPDAVNFAAAQIRASQTSLQELIAEIDFAGSTFVPADSPAEFSPSWLGNQSNAQRVELVAGTVNTFLTVEHFLEV